MPHQKNLPSSLCHGLQVPNPECQKKKKNTQNELDWIIKVLKKSSKEETYFDFGHSIT
jgi:predicted secreted Zn-dependent protease